MTRAQWLGYLMQPGVIWTGLVGTVLQLVLGVANNFNLGGIGDIVTHYGLSSHLASGGLIAVLTGLFYAMTERVSGHTVATGAGAAAGGVSGTLGLALSQSFGITPVAAGATPLIDFTMLGTMLATFVGMIEPAATGTTQAATATPAAFDALALTQAFTMTAAGGGVGALVGRFFTGQQARRTTRKSHRPRHAHT